MHKKAVWIGAVLLLVAAWFFWPRPQPEKPPSPPQKAKTWQAQTPTLKLVSPDGELVWFLSASKIEFSEDGKVATVERLQAQLQAQEETIVVEAPGAKVDWKRQDIEFTGPVEVRSKQLSLTAQSLSWQAKAKELQAWGGVEATTSTGKLKGQRLRWQQPRGKLVMEGGVKLWATTGAGS